MDEEETTKENMEEPAEEKQGEKYYDEPIYRPFGGAKSFEEVETQETAFEYSMKVGTVTDQLRGIIHNITMDDELESSDKASAISKAAEEYRKRISAIKKTENKEGKGIWQKAKALFDKPRPVSQFNASGFKIFEDSEGNQRWMALSSNAFEDRDKELFTTDALEEAVEYADKNDERGPLLVHHVPSAEIGHADFQAVVGRFLVESGTFADTPLGRKAVEYLSSADEEHQVSIGYQYIDGDEKDGQYDWLRISERSVCLPGTAANPWTNFQLVGEKVMDEAKIAIMKKVFGDELAEQVINSAEEKTKELQAQGIRFKEMQPKTFSNEFGTFTQTPEGAWNFQPVNSESKESKDDEEDEKKKKMESKKEDESTPIVTTEQLSSLAGLIAELTSKVDALTPVAGAVTAIQEEVKELKKTDDEKFAALMTPRNIPRPTENTENIMVNGKEATKSDEEEVVNPVQAYINDLMSVPAQP